MKVIPLFTFDMLLLIRRMAPTIFIKSKINICSIQYHFAVNDYSELTSLLPVVPRRTNIDRFVTTPHRMWRRIDLNKLMS